MWLIILAVAIVSACLASYAGKCWNDIRVNQKLALVDHFERLPFQDENKGLLLGIRVV
jgi:hypothetical protein